MSMPWRQASIAFVSALLLLIGAGTVLLDATQSSATHDDRQTHTIHMTDSHYPFNPPTCIIHRGDRVRWYNATDEQRHIVVLGTMPREYWEIGWTMLLDEVLAPGEYSKPSGPWEVNDGAAAYFDPTRPEIPNHQFLIRETAAQCGQVTPTPTPTPSPTPTLTPTPSPTPTVTPTPSPTPTPIPTPDSWSAIVPNVTRDEAE